MSNKKNSMSKRKQMVIVGILAIIGAMGLGMSALQKEQMRQEEREAQPKILEARFPKMKAVQGEFYDKKKYVETDGHVTVSEATENKAGDISFDKAGTYPVEFKMDGKKKPVTIEMEVLDQKFQVVGGISEPVYVRKGVILDMTQAVGERGEDTVEKIEVDTSKVDTDTIGVYDASYIVTFPDGSVETVGATVEVVSNERTDELRKKMIPVVGRDNYRPTVNETMLEIEQRKNEDALRKSGAEKTEPKTEAKTEPAKVEKKESKAEKKESVKKEPTKSDSKQAGTPSKAESKPTPSKPAESKPESKPAETHVHNWVSQYRTIPAVPAQGYYKQIPAVTQSTYRYKTEDGKIFDDAEAASDYSAMNSVSFWCFEDKVVITPASQEWVETAPAQPERQELIGYQCSSCGAWK